jgi:hypothetical protein
MAYIITVNAIAIATTAPPKSRCVFVVAPDWLVVEELTEEGIDDATAVSVGVEVMTGAVSVGIEVLKPVVGIETFPVTPGAFTDGRGVCK